jgi:PilZ domain
MPTQMERRRQQRFAMQLPLSIMMPGCSLGPTCMTRDVSSGGVYFWADTWDDNTRAFQFCTVLPEQVTLGDSVMAKCAAIVLRVEREKFSKVGVAAKIKGWNVM